MICLYEGSHTQDNNIKGGPEGGGNFVGHEQMDSTGW